MLKSSRELRIPENATEALRTSISNAALIKQNMATLNDDCVVERTPAEVLRNRIENIIVALPAMFNLQGHQSDLELEIVQMFTDWGLMTDVEAEAFIVNHDNVSQKIDWSTASYKQCVNRLVSRPVGLSRTIYSDIPLGELRDMCAELEKPKAPVQVNTESNMLENPFTFRVYAERLNACGIPSYVSQILYNHLDMRGQTPISGSHTCCRNYLFDTTGMSIGTRKVMLESFRDSLVGITNSALYSGDAGYSILNRFSLQALSEVMLYMAGDASHDQAMRAALNTAFGKDLAPAYKKLILDIMEIDQNVYDWRHDAKEIYSKYELHTTVTPSVEVRLFHVKQFRDSLIECLKYAHISADSSYEEKSTECLAHSVMRLVEDDPASLRMFLCISDHNKFPTYYSDNLARKAAIEEVVAKFKIDRIIAENMTLKELYQVIKDSIKN